MTNVFSILFCLRFFSLYNIQKTLYIQIYIFQTKIINNNFNKKDRRGQRDYRNRSDPIEILKPGTLYILGEGS